MLLSLLHFYCFGFFLLVHYDVGKKCICAYPKCTIKIAYRRKGRKVREEKGKRGESKSFSQLWYFFITKITNNESRIVRERSH